MKCQGPKTIITDQYELFDIWEFNRDVKKKRQITESMKAHGFDEGCPLNCRPNGNGKYKIVQGHHRFEVAKSLGIPVVAVISKSTTPVFSLELGNHVWNTNDYVTGHARAGKEELQAVREWQKMTGLPLGLCISWLAGEVTATANKCQHAKRGTYKRKNIEQACRFAELCQYAEDVGFEGAKTSIFAVSVAMCAMVEGWDDGRWEQKCKANAGMLRRQPNRDAYLQMIENIYNSRTRGGDELALVFPAKALCRARSASNMG